MVQCVLSLALDATHSTTLLVFSLFSFSFSGISIAHVFARIKPKMASPSTPPALDHIVILVPHATLQNMPPWLTTAFTLAPGGRHADGVTENKLILFQDGVYLELIAFIPGQEGDTGRQAHRWGARRTGHMIDWANTLPREDDLARVRRQVEQAQTGIAYAEPLPGGRVRPDGVELRWVTCSPTATRTSTTTKALVGGEAPFWCLDRTPRALRVPYRADEGRLARHPCGAEGVHGVEVFVRDPVLFRALKATYDVLQGHAGQRLEREEGAGEAYRWTLHVPDPVGGDGAGSGPGRTLLLVENVGGSDGAPGGDVDVKLSLFTSARSHGKVGGTLGDEDWAVEFDLVGRHEAERRLK